MRISSSIFGIFEDERTWKQKKPALRLACLVDYTGKISNLLEDIKKVERFLQNIENQKDTILREK